jgi:putative membrane protein
MFLADAGRMHVKERELAKLAMTKSQNEDVRQYAEDIADDHADALKDLVDLMEKHNVQQPADLDQVRNAELAKVQNLSGEAFDRQFMNMMVTNHEQALNTFRREASSAHSDEVRDYAKNLVPTLEEHLDDAREVQQKLSNAGTASPKGGK